MQERDAGGEHIAARLFFSRAPRIPIEWHWLSRSMTMQMEEHICL
jgi:hypothetical protein